MEFLSAVATALLSLATGIFASTAVVEILSKLLKQIIIKRIALNPAKKTERWTTTDSEGPKLSGEAKEAIGAKAKPPRPPAPYIRGPKSSQSRPPLGPFFAFLLVVCVFASAIGVIWSLTHIGGPIEASVKTTIEKAGGSILIVGSGLFGAFFAIALLAFAAIHIFSKRD